MAKDRNISCHQSVCHRSTVNMSPVVMPRCVLILKTIKRHKISQRTESSTSYSVCVMMGTSGPVANPPHLYFPLTSVFLSTYLTSPLDANTNQHFMCPVQWNDLPEATWQDMNSPGPPPASCRLLIRRRCAGVLVAGLSIPTPFPTSHASFPTPPLSYSDSKVWGVEKHVYHHSGLENLDAILGNIWGGGTGEWNKDKRAGVVQHS